MSRSSKLRAPNRLASDIGLLLRRAASRKGARRIAALTTLTIREALRSRVLLGMIVLTCLFGAASLLWPADLDGDRVILVQRLCYLMLAFFGVIAAAFLGGSALPREISSKRIYSVATKPVSRLEMLLGKCLGLIGVMCLFLTLGGLVTLIVTHAASARKTYKGGSYTLEVVVPSAQIRPRGKGKPVSVERGQTLVADGEREDSYDVTIARRDTTVVGTIPKAAVRLHERSLRLRRVAAAKEISARCIGSSAVARNELHLMLTEVAQNDVWWFDVAKLDLPRSGQDTDVRLRFWGLRHEPIRGKRAQREKPHVEFLFRNPATQKQVRKEVDFSLQQPKTPPAPESRRPPDHYEAVFTLPYSLFAGGTFTAEILDYTPKYPERGRIFYSQTKSPTWRISGFNTRSLPSGAQTFQLRFLVHYTKGLDLIDNTEVTAQVRNPATGRSQTFPLHLRDRTTSYLHFPRELIDARRGVELTISGIRPYHSIGHYSKESPVYLLLAPGSFWASTVRSVFLILLYLSLFTILAVAASTFLSAPVAILLTLTVVLAGLVKDFLFQIHTRAELESPALLAREMGTLLEQLGVWVKYFLVKLLAFLGPGFEPFSSTAFVKRGWAVPWSAVSSATCYALLYMLACFSFGFLLFRSREFE